MSLRKEKDVCHSISKRKQKMINTILLNLLPSLIIFYSNKLEINFKYVFIFLKNKLHFSSS